MIDPKGKAEEMIDRLFDLSGEKKPLRNYKLRRIVKTYRTVKARSVKEALAIAEELPDLDVEFSAAEWTVLERGPPVNL